MSLYLSYTAEASTSPHLQYSARSRSPCQGSLIKLQCFHYWEKLFFPGFTAQLPQCQTGAVRCHQLFWRVFMHFHLTGVFQPLAACVNARLRVFSVHYCLAWGLSRIGKNFFEVISTSVFPSVLAVNIFSFFSLFGTFHPFTLLLKCPVFSHYSSGICFIRHLFLSFPTMLFTSGLASATPFVPSSWFF